MMRERERGRGRRGRGWRRGKGKRMNKSLSVYVTEWVYEGHLAGVSAPFAPS